MGHRGRRQRRYWGPRPAEPHELGRRRDLDDHEHVVYPIRISSAATARQAQLFQGEIVMRLAISLSVLGHLLGIVICFAASACGTGFDCERDCSCPPGASGSSTGGTGGTGGGPICPEDPDPADGYIPDECGI